MLRASQTTEAFSRLEIVTNWSTLPATQYRHTKFYFLIEKWVLMHRNSEEPEKCPQSLVRSTRKKKCFQPKSVAQRPVDLGFMLAIMI